MFEGTANEKLCPRFSFPEVLEGSDYGVVVHFVKREATTKAARLKSAVARIS